MLGLSIAWGAQILARYETHPPHYTYGYKKSPLLAAFINALLVLLSVAIIIRENIH